MLILDEAIREAFRPRSVEPLHVWASRNFWVERSSQFKGLYNPQVGPWLNEPIDANFNPRVRMNFVSCAAQSGKTTAGQIFAAHTPAESPGDMLLVMNSRNQAKRLMKQRLKPVLKKCSAAWTHVATDDEDAVQAMEISFDNCFMAATGAESLGELQSFPFSKLWLEEVRNWKNRESMPVVLKRTTAFWNCKVYGATCPGMVGDEADEQFSQGTQKHAVVTLPCGCEVEMLWEVWVDLPDGAQERRGMCWDKNEQTYDAERDDYKWSILFKTVRYKCQKCGAEVRDDISIRRAIAATCRYDARNPNADGSCESFTWNALIVWWIRWNALVKEFLTAKRMAKMGSVKALKDFINERLAQAFEDRSVWGDSKKRIALGDYRKRDPVPPEFKYKWAGIDVQQDHCWVVIVAMKPTCETRILFEGKVKGSLEVVHGIQKEFGVGGRGCGIDNAYQKRAIEVRNAAARYGWNTFEEVNRKPFSWRTMDENGHPAFDEQGKPLYVQRIYDDAIHVALPHPLRIPINVGGKRMIQQVNYVNLIRWVKEATLDIVYHWRTGNPPKQEPLIIPPSDVSADWLEHMQGMTKVLRVNPRSGKRAWEWIETQKRFDMLMCHAIITVISSMAGLVAIDPSDPFTLKSGAQQVPETAQEPPQEVAEEKQEDEIN